jgi:hypothetical protein
MASVSVVVVAMGCSSPSFTEAMLYDDSTPAAGSDSLQKAQSDTLGSMKIALYTLAVLVSCSGCALYSIDDRYLQDRMSRPYAERVCAKQAPAQDSDAYEACVTDKARRRLALWACTNQLSSIYFKEDTCAEAE